MRCFARVIVFFLFANQYLCMFAVTKELAFGSRTYNLTTSLHNYTYEFFLSSDLKRTVMNVYKDESELDNVKQRLCTAIIELVYKIVQKPSNEEFASAAQNLKSGHPKLDDFLVVHNYLGCYGEVAYLNGLLKAVPSEKNNSLLNSVKYIIESVGERAAWSSKRVAQEIDYITNKIISLVKNKEEIRLYLEEEKKRRIDMQALICSHNTLKNEIDKAKIENEQRIKQIKDCKQKIKTIEDVNNSNSHKAIQTEKNQMLPRIEVSPKEEIAVFVTALAAGTILILAPLVTVLMLSRTNS